VRVRLSDEAGRDLEQIGDHIAADDPLAVDRFIAELVGACHALGEFPNRFPLAERFSNVAVRQRAYGNYLIFYLVGEDEVVVIRVLHGAMDYAALLFRP
jgi:plasmid stabilization system protein ParE